MALHPMTERQYHRICYEMLEIIDECPDGVSITKMEEIMEQAVSFAVFCRAFNYLWTVGLVRLDPQHVAHRVRS